MNTTIRDLTSNQFYGGINRRFDNRAIRLFRCGFAYEIIELGDKRSMAIFKRRYRGMDQIIPACDLQNMCARLWIDALRRLLTY